MLNYSNLIYSARESKYFSNKIKFKSFDKVYGNFYDIKNIEYSFNILNLKKKKVNLFKYNKVIKVTDVNKKLFRSLQYKKDLVKFLTKRQKKRIKMSKIHRVITPSFYQFPLNKKYNRNLTVFGSLFKSKGLIHDGYSWHLVRFPIFSLGSKMGSLCFKTRSISPIKLADKGKLHLDMSKKGTYKIKRVKIRRKR